MKPLSFMLVKKSKFLLIFLLPFFSCIQINKDGSKINSDKSDTTPIFSSGKWFSEDEFYSIYYLRNLKIKLTNIRPNQSDTSIKLCIPVAFTQLDDGSIDGLFIIDGKPVDAKKVNHRLGGGFLMIKDSVSIIKTNDGKFLSSSCIDSLSKLNASFFQQIQLVREGENLGFHKDEKLFQRRAISVFPNGNIAIIETKSPVTLQEFADDLVKMKIQNAIYTDMGSYDEGWARIHESGSLKVLGNIRSETQRQSNWLIFKN
ncbi:MAG: hypothetical protein NT084_07740 [Bacteroidetes bacterium]|nr:hypothetical protein [Bacteroidota bacterium]